jgi:hypothetical protein
MLAANVMALDIGSGDWQVATPIGGQFDISTIGHWDPYNLTTIVHGDFDGDGAVDVAGWSNLGYWLVGRTDGDGQLRTEQWIHGWAAGAIWKTTQVGDFNGDGKDDIVMFSSGGGWWVCRSTGAGFVAEVWMRFPVVSGWSTHRVGDFNGDGRSDLANFYAPTAEWRISLSSGTELRNGKWATLPARTGWSTPLVGDFNGDGLTDIANYHAPSGAWWVSENGRRGSHDEMVGQWSVARLCRLGCPRFQWRFARRHCRHGPNGADLDVHIAGRGLHAAHRRAESRRSRRAHPPARG